MSVSTGQNEDREAPSSADISDREGSTIGENIRVQTSLDAEELANLPDEITPTLQSATIDCGPENTNVESQPSQVNDSDPLEMLADHRGTETLPLTPSSNLCRVDIEEFDDET